MLHIMDIIVHNVLLQHTKQGYILKTNNFILLKIVKIRNHTRQSNKAIVKCSETTESSKSIVKTKNKNSNNIDVTTISRHGFREKHNGKEWESLQTSHTTSVKDIEHLW